MLAAVFHWFKVFNDVFSKISSGIRIHSALYPKKTLLLVESSGPCFVRWARAYLISSDKIEDAAIFTCKLQVSPASEGIAVFLDDASSDIVLGEHHGAARFVLGKKGDGAASHF